MDNDFDTYLNEVSGEDVTSGSTSSEMDTTSTDQSVSDTTRGGSEAPIFPGEKQPTINAKTTYDPQGKAKGQQQPEQLRPHVLGGFINAEGDIVDEKGAVIAQKGTVRRVYEENGRLKQRLGEFQEQINQMKVSSGANNLLNGMPTRLGLVDTDVARALDLAARVKRGDIVGVAKELVAQAVAEGKNVTEIVGETVGDSVDMRAIKQMLDSHLGPIQDVRKQSEENNRITQVAKQQYNKFIDENPHANIHEFEIASIAKNDGISPQKAYNALRDFAARHQLDFSIPLDAQVRARQVDTGKQPANVRPMPNGAARGGGGNGMHAPQPEYADPNDDWSSIIRDAQRSLRQ